MAVSSVTGKGFEELISMLPNLVKEYEEYYEADLKANQAKNGRDPATILKEMTKVQQDLGKSGPN